MSYPRSVYHKDYVGEKADEAMLKKYCKLAKSEEDHKNLGPDWGYVSEVKPEEPEVVEKKSRRKASQVQAEE